MNLDSVPLSFLTVLLQNTQDSVDMLGRQSFASLGIEITKAPISFSVLEGSSGEMFLPCSFLGSFQS